MNKDKEKWFRLSDDRVSKAELLSGFAVIDISMEASPLPLPPSLSSITFDYEPEAEERAARRNAGPMVPVKMTYDDEFAPSGATLSIEDPTRLETKGGRLFMYNHHLIGEGQRSGTLEQVMEEAEELGCPRFPPPSLWIETSEEECYQASTRCAVLVQNVEEHSEEWLVLNCYMNAVFATDAANKGASVAMIGKYMILLGATLRELELVRRNKRDALRGKTTLRAAAKGGKMQNAHVSEQTLDLVAYMKKRIEGGATVAAAARWAFQSNLGSSASANRIAWYRSRKKV